MSPEEKQRLKNKKKYLKEKQRILRSNKYICGNCGFVGKPKKDKRGSWILFFIKLAIALPIVITIVVLSFVEGFIKMITFSGINSAIWNTGFARFFPTVPQVLFACRDCGNGNSMKRLSSQEGKLVYERFDREHFITRH